MTQEERLAYLDSVRGQINELDRNILALLNSRASISLEVGRIKDSGGDAVFKPLREKEVMNRLAAENKGPLPEHHLRAIYREIFSSSRQLQRPQRVVYLGPEGTFSYFAGVDYLGHSADYAACETFDDVFRNVILGDADLGIIPLENSMQGTVGQNLDLFMQHDVYIQAETYCRISHSLLSECRTLDEVKLIYSHPQALAQCQNWIRTRLPGVKLIPTDSTASAAGRIRGEAGAAAIGHRRLADMLGLGVLAARIEDMPDNWTRFLVIGRTPTLLGNKDKTSLLFTLPDRPGALAGVLNVLACQGINMKKLESRPLRGERWKYVFFVDVECDLGGSEYAQAIEELQAATSMMRVLGAYPAGPYLDVSRED